MAGFVRNHRPTCFVISGRLASEYATGGSGSSNYLEFLDHHGQFLTFTNTSTGDWSVNKLRLEIESEDAQTTWFLLGEWTFPAVEVKINYTIDFEDVRVTYGDRAGLSTLFERGYKNSNDWRYQLRNNSVNVGAAQTQAAAVPFSDYAPAAMRRSAALDFTNNAAGGGTGSDWSANGVRVEMKPAGSGSYGLIGQAAFATTSILVNQTIRLTNITFTFS